MDYLRRRQQVVEDLVDSVEQLRSDLALLLPGLERHFVEAELLPAVEQGQPEPWDMAHI